MAFIHDENTRTGVSGVPVFDFRLPTKIRNAGTEAGLLIPRWQVVTCSTQETQSRQDLRSNSYVYWLIQRNKYFVVIGYFMDVDYRQ